ncbi:hypothetical protein HQ584_08050 [Patescibacteria group bacterium]|nr:hypothetical protein [Patescibacteria group bacterium]
MAIKKIIKADEIKNLRIPKEMGEYVEVIIFPAKVSQAKSKKNDYFEIVTEDGEDIRVPNWTDEEWNEMSISHILNTKDDQDVDWEDFFNVKDR